MQGKWQQRRFYAYYFLTLILNCSFVKDEYLNQLNLIAPDYLSETYKAVLDQDGSVFNVLVKISPPNSSSGSDETNLAAIKYCLENKKDVSTLYK